MFTDRLHEAEGCFTTCAVMWSDVIPGYFHRGVCRLQLEKYAEAEQDFATILATDADFVPALINRAVARRAQDKFDAAREDLDRAIALHASQTRVFFMRSELRRQLGDPEGAKADFDEGIIRQPADEQSFVRRGFALMDMFPERALEDFQAAARLNPRSYAAHRNWAYVLGERLGQPQAAIRVLDRMLQWDPHQVDELLSRGVMYARLGQRSEAIRDAEAALKKRRDARTLFQAACVYALISNDNEHDASVAVKLVKEAVADDPKWIAVAIQDADLERLRGRDDFDELLATKKASSKLE
jgi:tetratricopeptide (TPR) repeat protein